MRIGFCVSGRGRVVEAILEAKKAGLLGLEGARGLIDRPSPFAETAARHNLPLDVVDVTKRHDREACRQAIASLLCSWPVDGLFLTFDWLLPKQVVDQFGPNVVNLHMSLLPEFPGFGAIKAALDSDSKQTGITYHIVDHGRDTGPILAQSAEPITESMNASTLGFRLFLRAVPLGIQVARWMENDHLSDALREAASRSRASGDLFSPTIDSDIARFSATYLDRYAAAVTDSSPAK